MRASMSTLRYSKFGLIHRTQLIAVEVECMYANYAIWGRRSGGPEDDFFQCSWVAPTGRVSFLVGVEQCTVTFQKHVELWCGCGVLTLRDWTHLQ